MPEYRVIRKRPGEPDSFYDLKANNWPHAFTMVSVAVAKASIMENNRVEDITDVTIVRKP